MEWQHLLCKLCFGHDFATAGTSARLIVPTFQQAAIIVRAWWCTLRPGSSTDSAMSQCARRVGRIRNNGKIHSAASGSRATRGGDMPCWFNTYQVTAWFREFAFREHKGAFLLIQSLLQIIAFRSAMEPSDNCT